MRKEIFLVRLFRRMLAHGVQNAAQIHQAFSIHVQGFDSGAARRRQAKDFR
jgi:hypothetical protein